MMSVATPCRFSQLLREKIAFVSVKPLEGVTIWDDPRLSSFYPDLLFVGHCIIRASVPLMQAALRTVGASNSDDPVGIALVNYFSHHILEEMDHDDWLLQDLAELGVTSKQVLARMPPASVAQLVGSQYYWILHHDPVALLGYIAVLEGSPLSQPELELAISTSGIPQTAFRTLMKHAMLDPHHRDDLDVVLDSLPLTAAQANLVGSSAILTTALLDNAFAEVLPPDLCGR